jgi:hypothetical protein
MNLSHEGFFLKRLVKLEGEYPTIKNGCLLVENSQTTEPHFVFLVPLESPQ